MAVKKTYRINLRNYGSPPAVMVSQYDEGYAIAFEIFDGPLPVLASSLSGYTFKLKGRQPGNPPFLAYEFEGTLATALNAVVSFEIDTTMTGRAGKGTAELVILDEENDVKFASVNFAVYTEPAAVPDGSIDADVQRAMEIAEEVQEIVDTAAAEVKGEAEAWAVGQRDGEDVPSTDPTYENNAKYYAEQAQDIADSIGIDATLSISGKAADAKKTGDEISSLKEELTGYIENATVTENGQFADWKQGTLKSDTGEESTSTTRCRTASYYSFPAVTEKIKITIASGFKLSAREYTSKSASTYTGASVLPFSTGTVEMSVNPNYYYRFLIGKTDDGNLSPSGISDGDVLFTYHIVTDTTLSERGKPADAEAVGNKISILDNITAEKIPLPFTANNGKYIMYSDGTLETGESFFYTDYIDVSKYKQLLFKRTMSTSSNPSNGVAFYNASKTYISGLQSLKSMPAYGYFSELVMANIPDTAKYARFTGWTNTETYGTLEIYGVNGIYYHDVETDNLLSAYQQSRNIVPYSNAYYRRLPAYLNSDANTISIENVGDLYVLNGTTVNADVRIKVSGSLSRASTNSGVDGFSGPINLIKGHRYKVTLKAISGDKSGVSLSVYQAGTHNTVGAAYSAKGRYTRIFRATDTEYHIVIYVAANTTIDNLVCSVTLTDLTGDYLDVAENGRVYSDPNYATMQSAALIGKKLYAYESTNYGRMHVVDLPTGEKTVTSIALGHGNGMTMYNGKLYVVAGTDENSNRIYIVDPNTMEIDSYVDFVDGEGTAVPCYSIAYDKTNDQFILLHASKIHFATNALVYKSTVERDYVSGSTRQDIECDGYNIYCVEADRNNISIYDFSGAWVTEISLATGNEPECLIYDWAGGWWLLTNIPAHEWYFDAVNLRNHVTMSQMVALAKTF